MGSKANFAATSTPEARPEVFDAYWRLAAERQRIYFRRMEGELAPWTRDPILGSYKFCNAYRASDRVSQYLIRNVIYPGEYTAEDQLLRIVLFRLFSKPETWELLCERHGDVTAAGFDFESFGDTLDSAIAAGRTLYTSAFILCANRAYGHARKHRNHLELVQEMMRPAGLPRELARARSLRDLYESLRRYPLIGPFMAYQLAVDINYSELCDFDESEHTVAGPGAKRGVAKCFSDTRGWSEERIIMWVTASQAREFDRREIDFPSLYGRPLQSIDIQNLFCELDKYARVAFPQLISNRKQIKARFTPTGALPEPFFPPKWGLRPGAPATRRQAGGSTLASDLSVASPEAVERSPLPA